MNIKNEALVRKLEKNVFTDKEALVYVSLLELGGASPSLVSEYSGLKRATVYNVLTTLSVRGIVNEIKKKDRLFYQIDKPEKVFRYAESKVRRAEDDLDNTKEIIPDIEGLFSVLKNRPKVTYYEGVDGLLSIYEDITTIKTPHEMLMFSKADEFGAFLPREFMSNLIKKKAEIGITVRAIFPDTEANRNFNGIYYKDAPENIWPKCRYISADSFPFVGEIIVYGDSKVAIINFDKDQMIGVVIKDKSLHKMMGTIFELSWDSRLVRE
jgi:hypothetical protein